MKLLNIQCMNIYGIKGYQAAIWICHEQWCLTNLITIFDRITSLESELDCFHIYLERYYVGFRSLCSKEPVRQYCPVPADTKLFREETLVAFLCQNGGFLATQVALIFGTSTEVVFPWSLYCGRVNCVCIDTQVSMYSRLHTGLTYTLTYSGHVSVYTM